MKLFYDNLFNFMPTSLLVDGKFVPNKKLEAARNAMVALAAYQTTGDINALYSSVYHISAYGEVDVIDLIKSLKTVQVETGTVEELLDAAALSLFNNIKPAGPDDTEPFDYRKYAATLLAVAHTLYAVTMNTPREPVEEDQK